MTPEAKLILLTETIEAEPGELGPDVALESLDIWDSLAKLSVLAMFSTKFHRELEISKLKTFATVGDVLAEMHE